MSRVLKGHVCQSSKEVTRMLGKEQRAKMSDLAALNLEMYHKTKPMEDQGSANDDKQVNPFQPMAYFVN